MTIEGKDTSVIPHGLYCYDQDMTTVTMVLGKPPQVNFKTCPYFTCRKFDVNSERDMVAIQETDQEYIGCCSFLEKDDADFTAEGHTSLLFEMIKECEINLTPDTSNDQAF